MPSQLDNPPGWQEPLIDLRTGLVAPRWRPFLSRLTAVAQAGSENWTTAQRPTGNALWVGRTGYNTTLSKLESWDGSAWQIEPLLLHVRDEKASGTAGGVFTSGARRTRVLNVVKTNEISGASLGSNQITLPAGTYWIEARAPAHAVDRHKLTLRDTTNSVDLVTGSNLFSSNASGGDNVQFLSGRFTLSGAAALELQHECQTTKSGDGLGVAANFGEVEVYAEAMIWKVA